MTQTFDQELDEVLGQMLGGASVEFMSHPDGKRIVMPAEELLEHQRKAKQAILTKLDSVIDKLNEPAEVTDESSLDFGKKFRPGVIDVDELRKALSIKGEK